MEPRTYPLEESGQLLVDPRRIWATHMMLPALWQGPRRTRRYVYLLCQPIRPRALRGPAYDWYESNFPLMSWDPELFEAVELTNDRRPQYRDNEVDGPHRVFTESRRLPVIEKTG